MDFFLQRRRKNKRKCAVTDGAVLCFVESKNRPFSPPKVLLFCLRDRDIDQLAVKLPSAECSDRDTLRGHLSFLYLVALPVFVELLLLDLFFVHGAHFSAVFKHRLGLATVPRRPAWEFSAELAS